MKSSKLSFSSYLASPEDPQVVTKALKCAKNQKLKFIFKDYRRIKNTRIVSYDSKYIYIWKLNSSKPIRIPHKIRIRNNLQIGWKAGLETNRIKNLLPKKLKNSNRFDAPIISGGLFTPFIELQKQKRVTNNPYITKESYLATIVHELGHVYWNSFKLWWFSDKQTNLGYFNCALKLYKDNNCKNITLKHPVSHYLGEIYAYCCEYYASQIFWPTHKMAIDKYAQNQIADFIKKEEKKNLNEEDSVLEPSVNIHDYALILGKIIMDKHPNNWPTILTNPITF